MTTVNQRCLGLARLLIILIVATAIGSTCRAQDAPILRIEPGGHTAGVKSVQFTPSGKQLISAGLDKSLRVWDVETGRQRALRYRIGRGVDGQAFCAAVSPDLNSTIVAVGVASEETHSPCDIYLFDYSTDTLKRRLRGHKGTVTGLAFSADGSRMASCDTEGTIRLWDSATWNSLHDWKR